MIRTKLGAATAAGMLALSAGAAAQNTTDPGPATTPPTGTERPTTTRPTTPDPTTEVPDPPRTSDPAPRTSDPTIVTVPVPVPQATPAPPPLELPTTAYPNGFADPTMPYGNDMSVAVREQEGFDWGLLGLLGLFGLLGLRRARDGFRHVVHSERYDEGRSHDRDGRPIDRR